MEVALEVGAEDVTSHDDGSIDVITTPDAFISIKTAMTAAGLAPEHADVTMNPSLTVPLELVDAQKVMALIDMLEDLDDVQNVYSNADFSDEVMAQLDN